MPQPSALESHRLPVHMRDPPLKRPLLATCDRLRVTYKPSYPYRTNRPEKKRHSPAAAEYIQK